MNALQLTDLIVVDGDDEPRVQDVRLAERLGYNRPRAIRQLIENQGAELDRYGAMHRGTVIPQGGGTPYVEYRLNEGQALLICMRSDAPHAADVRAELIAVFQAWRRGKLAPAQPVTEHLLRLEAKMDELSIDQRVVRDVVVQLFKEREGARQHARNEFTKQTITQHVDFRHYEGGLCCVCGWRRIIEPNGLRVPRASAVHHINDRGRSDTWNAMLMCNPCHDDVHASPPRITEADFHQIAGQYQRRFVAWMGGKQIDLAIPPVAALLPRYTDQTRKPEARPTPRKRPIKVGLSMFDLDKRCGDAS
jgi:hypothetical protein